MFSKALLAKLKVKSVRISSPAKGLLQIECLVENILKTMLMTELFALTCVRKRSKCQFKR